MLSHKSNWQNIMSDMIFCVKRGMCVCVYLLMYSWIFSRMTQAIITLVLVCSGCYNPIPYSGWLKGFPGSSAGKESACNAGNPSLTPGLGRSAGEEIGYPLQCSWASLLAQLIRNLFTMQETWIQSLGRRKQLKNNRNLFLTVLEIEKS